MRFDVCLETGPRHRKTMAHAVTLPGATAMGPTVDDAIEHLAAAIRVRVGFLRRHGEPFPEPEPLELVVTEMDTSGDFLGYGAVSFAADRAAVDADELRRDMRWLEWSRGELVEAARSQPGGLAGHPDGKGRSAGEVLAHVAGAERGYLNALVGPVPGLGAAATTVERSGERPWEALALERSIVRERLAALTDDERSQVVQRGRTAQTARRTLRKMLEHEWEHVLELQARLAN